MSPLYEEPSFAYKIGLLVRKKYVEKASTKELI